MAETKEYIKHQEARGSVNISEEVVAVIAASAAMEVEGVAGLALSAGKDLSEMLAKKSISKSVRIQIGEDSLTTDLYIQIKMGYSVSGVGCAVQERVQQAVESTTGFHSAGVNVHVTGIALK